MWNCSRQKCYCCICMCIYQSFHTKNKALHLYTFHPDFPVDYNRALVVFRGLITAAIHLRNQSITVKARLFEKYCNDSKVLKPNPTWPQPSSFVCHVFLPAVTRNRPGKSSFLTPFCDELPPQRRNGVSWKCAKLANDLS